MPLFVECDQVALGVERLNKPVVRQDRNAVLVAQDHPEVAEEIALVRTGIRRRAACGATAAAATGGSRRCRATGPAFSLVGDDNGCIAATAAGDVAEDNAQVPVRATVAGPGTAAASTAAASSATAASTSAAASAAVTLGVCDIGGHGCGRQNGGRGKRNEQTTYRSEKPVSTFHKVNSCIE
ncbi:hypothetical protein GCM10011319_47610 [Mameliella alba]|nr:hypothetical protein GCM10011319_47610 [Mameliella alba]